MKVAHILRKYDPGAWGGTESAVLELVRGLRASGVESVLFAPALGAPSDARDPFAEEGFVVRRFRAFLPVLGLSAAARARSISVGGNLASLSLPWQLARERGVDVVHSHVLGRLGGTARRVAQLRRVPFVVTIHGGYLDLPPAVRADLGAATQKGIEVGQPIGWAVGARRVVERADAVLSCNPREAELLHAKFPSQRVVLMPHGIPVQDYARDEREAALQAWPALRGKKSLLMVGRIDPVKNQLAAVEALAAVRERFPDALLVLAGAATDEAYGAAVHAAVHARGLGEHVLRTGGIPPRDARLRGLFQLAEAVLLPSLSETFGLVILEAWAARTPVVVTPTSGALQLIADGENGVLVPHGDTAALARAMIALLEDPSRAAAMGRAGHAAAEAYASEQVAAKYKALYEDLGRTPARHEAP